jgi:hypothetical protein
MRRLRETVLALPDDEIECCRDGSSPQLAPMTSKSPRTWKQGARPDKHPLLVGGLADSKRHLADQ